MTIEQAVSMIKDFTLAVVIFYFYTRADNRANLMQQALIETLQKALKDSTDTIRQQGAVLANLTANRQDIPQA
jgi:hypothetical protein